MIYTAPRKIGFIKNSHDKLLEELIERLSEKYSVYGIEEEHSLSEVDLWVYVKNNPLTAYLFEVKTSDIPKTRKKSSRQLDINSSYLHNNYGFKRIIAFKVFGKPKYHIEYYKTYRYK